MKIAMPKIGSTLLFPIIPIVAHLGLALQVLLIVGCSSAKKLPPESTLGAPGQPKIVVPTAAPLEVLKASKDKPALLARAVTSLGDNRAPKFSPDGSKLLFLSSGRPSHHQAQVYELDLLRMTERRVTFHGGDDEGANWDTNSRIVYSSITDEIKEDVSLARIKSVYEASKSAAANPNGMRPTPKIANGGEIYLQRLDGRAIERITDQPGPDVSPTASSSPHNSKIVFVSSRSGDPRLYIYSGTSTRSISHGPDAAPAFSFDGKSLAWERTLPSTDSKAALHSQIFMTETLRSADPLTSPGFRDQQPAWSAKGDFVIFSSNRGDGTGGKTFGLFTIDRKASCLKRLTEVQTDLFWPTVSPDGSKIAFSAKVNGQNQIYLMDNRADAFPCVTVPSTKP
jgi:Tol biopolymer transport system component